MQVQHGTLLRGRRNFYRRATSIFCLSFSSCWLCNANERSQNPLPFLKQKQNVPCYGNSHKNNSQVFYGNLHNCLSAGFPSKALLFKEALPWSLTKPETMTLFYLETHASVTYKQDLQTSEISSKAIHLTFKKTLQYLLIFSWWKLIIHKPNARSPDITYRRDFLFFAKYWG